MRVASLYLREKCDSSFVGPFVHSFPEKWFSLESKMEKSVVGKRTLETGFVREVKDLLGLFHVAMFMHVSSQSYSWP